MITRRRFVGGVLAAGAALGSFAREAEASLARAVSLGELVYDSRHVVLGAAVDSFARWEHIGQRKCIVTYSLYRVEQPLDGRVPPTSDLMIRTLGGTVGDIGQIFHGEAVVALGERSAVFLREADRDVFSVTAMSQGYYPVRPDPKGVHRLSASFGAIELVGTDSAMQRLHGRTVPDVEQLLAKELVLGR